MKKSFVLIGFLISIFNSLSAQESDKTKYSLQVSAAAAANRAEMAGYTWTRTVQVFVGGELNNTIISSLSLGTDGKIITNSSSTKPAKPPRTGIRGDIEKKKIDELKAYIDNALSVGMSYLFLSKGRMLDFFDAGTISKKGDSTSIVGANVNTAGDQLTMTIQSSTLAYISEHFKTVVSNGDAMTGNINYKTFSNGLTVIDGGELNLPGKTMKLVIANTNFAKKLQ
jgi:hypothetical protein